MPKCSGSESLKTQWILCPLGLIYRVRVRVRVRTGVWVRVRVRTGQGLGLVVEQNGGRINPVKFFEDSKNMG